MAINSYPLELLAREHRAIRGAATNLRRIYQDGEDVSGALTFVRQLAENHFRAEERAWLPVLEASFRRRGSGCLSPARAVRAAHRTLRRLLEQAADNPAEIPFLCAILEDHAAQEDLLLFPLCAALLDEPEKDAIARRLGLADPVDMPPPPPGPGFRLRHAYDAPSPTDGWRVLVDRLWPRGLSREKAALATWAKNLAPSTELRRWFNHQPDRFAEFRRRYREELSDPALAGELDDLTNRALTGPVTLLFAAADAECNQAVVLQEVLEERRLSKEFLIRWDLCLDKATVPPS